MINKFVMFIFTVVPSIGLFLYYTMMRCFILIVLNSVFLTNSILQYDAILIYFYFLTHALMEDDFYLTDPYLDECKQYLSLCRQSS